jgi:leucyl-tRNA synthetase
MSKKVADSFNIEIKNWPIAHDKYLIDDKITVAIQINGKVRDTIMINPDTSESEIRERVLDLPKIKSWTADSEIKKFIYIKDKIVSIVV